MTKVTIEKVFQDEKEGKYGKRLQVSVKVKETKVEDINGNDVEVAGKYIRGFFPADFKVPFKEGDEVDLLILMKGEYLNFSIPGVGKPPAQDTSDLANRISKLESQMRDVLAHLAVDSGEEPLDDIDNF